MLRTALIDSPPDTATRRPEFERAYRVMLMARVLDDKFASLYRASKIHGGVFLGRGQEAVSASLGLSLHQGDVFAPLIRDQAGRLAFGESLLDAARTYLGSPKGPMRARDGNVHRGRPREGLIPMISHLGAMISVVNGILLARRMRGLTGHVGATCIGEGGTSTGAFHEALNQAAIERLPLVLVIANNQFAYSTPNSRQFACEDLAERAASYGVASSNVDGTDLEACIASLSAAVDQARAGNGPQVVVATFLRLAGHGEHDDSPYISDAMRRSPLGRDCLLQARALLLERGWADEAVLERWKREAEARVDEAVAQAQREGSPDPYQEDWCAYATRHLAEGVNDSEGAQA